MSNIPFKEQKLPPNHLAFVQASIAAGDPVAGDDLLLAIEQIIGAPLPEEARNFLRLAVIPAVKTRGRPQKFGALREFALEEVDRLYPALLREEEQKKQRLRKTGKTPPKGDSPSLLAYGRLLQLMKSQFGPMTPEALKNMHSKWKNGHFHSADSEVNSEDFDAEIEQLFPAPRQES
jgi:hypothetical protein